MFGKSRQGRSAMRWTLLVGVLATVGLLAAACGGDDPTPTPVPPTPTSPPPTATPTPLPPGAPTPTPTPPPPTATPIPAWQIEWEQALAAGKQEGEVVILMGGSASRNYGPLFKDFENETGIKVTAVTGRGSQQVEKIRSEREAGIFSADVWMTGVTSSNNARKIGALRTDFADQLILPEVTDTSLWLNNQHWYSDPVTRDTIFTFCAGPSPQFAYNTDLVDISTINSYWDLTDDRFKGKIVGTLPWEPGQTNSDFYISNPLLGEDFIKKVLVDMDVLWVADGQQAVDLLVNGAKELFMYQGNASQDIDDLQEQGLPVANHFGAGFPEGGVLAAGGTCAMSLIDTPANPNAQKVFANWWLTSANLYKAQGITDDASLRIDIPQDNIRPQYVRSANVDYFWPEMDDNFAGNLGLAFNRQIADEFGLR